MSAREVPGEFGARHPYVTVTLLALTVILVYFVVGAATTILHQSSLVLYGSANLVLAVIAVILLTASRGWRACGFRGLSRPRSLWIFWLAAIPPLVNLTHGLAATDPGRVVAFLLLAALVGFVEEAFYRGLMLRPLAARGAWRAAVITALIFGLTHGMNALAGSNPGYVLLQIGYATAIGFGYAAMVLYTGLLWPLIVTHALTDVFGFLAIGGVGQKSGATAGEMALTAVYLLAFTTYGVFLLRRRHNLDVAVSP